MKEAITHDKLRIKCKLPIKTLHNFSLVMEPNEHAKGEIKGFLDLEEYSLAQLMDMLNDTGQFIAIENLNKNEVNKNIFCGFIQKVEITYEGQLAMITIQAVSATYLMDIKRKTRSFQKTTQTYQQLINEITGEYSGGNLIWEAEDKPIGKPLIQYQETDWEFIKRIVSHLHTSLMPDTSANCPLFFIGIRKGEVQGELNQKPYEWVLQENYYANRDVTGDMPKRKFILYETESMEAHQIGDQFLIRQMPYAICAMVAKLKDGILHFTYKLSGESYYTRKEYYNNRLKGLSFTGTVLRTNAEVLKLHLSIDEKQEEETAYFYSWKPLMGNLFYCMPEVGTKVGLHMIEADERKAVCTYSIRENGDTCKELVLPPDNLAVPNDRKYFRTIHGKQLYHDPSQITMEVQGDENTIVQLADEMGITCNTQSKITILANQKIELSGKQVFLKTKQEATLVKKDMAAPTVINICNAFDSVGTTGKFRKNQDTVSKVSFSGGGDTYELKKPEVLAAILPHMFSSIPVENVEEEVNLALGSIPILNKV